MYSRLEFNNSNFAASSHLTIFNQLECSCLEDRVLFLFQLLLLYSPLSDHLTMTP